MSVDPQAGEPARKFRKRETRAGHDPGGRWELIGPAECPIMWRLTLVSNRWFKVLWHRFAAGASDEAPHDHPRSFVTVVLRGGYDDMKPCPTPWHFHDDFLEKGPLAISPSCPNCDGSRWIVDEVRAPTIRFRSAEHAHITKVGPKGAVTLVVMGRVRREWGFWKFGEWHPWREFERKFGLNWRCPE